jgi:hypothetical protein
MPICSPRKKVPSPVRPEMAQSSIQRCCVTDGAEDDTERNGDPGLMDCDFASEPRSANKSSEPWACLFKSPATSIVLSPPAKGSGQDSLRDWTNRTTGTTADTKERPIPQRDANEYRYEVEPITSTRSIEEVGSEEPTGKGRSQRLEASRACVRCSERPRLCDPSRSAAKRPVRAGSLPIDSSEAFHLQNIPPRAGRPRGHLTVPSLPASVPNLPTAMPRK